MSHYCSAGLLGTEMLCFTHFIGVLFSQVSSFLMRNEFFLLLFLSVFIIYFTQNSTFTYSECTEQEGKKKAMRKESSAMMRGVISRWCKCVRLFRCVWVF